MGLEFKNISHKYGTSAALNDINLTAHASEVLCLLGPSGCGKTTLLNIAAGVLKLQGGEIWLGKKRLASPSNCPAPEARPIGLVFQDGALFPHMTVSENIAFGLDRKPDHKAVVANLLDQIGLPDFGQRYPHTLSGGQQQRIAVARALAPAPKVLLMDEPFANIDIALRRQLREDIRQFLKLQNCISIIVTHDPEEAMEISDKIAVMETGHIIQVGRPSEIYHSPKSLSVARLTSDGTAIRAHIKDRKVISDIGAWPMDCLTSQAGIVSGPEVNLFIRPKGLTPIKVKNESGLLIKDVRNTGQVQFLTLETAKGSNYSVQVDIMPEWTAGQSVDLVPRTKSIVAFPR